MSNFQEERESRAVHNRVECLASVPLEIGQTSRRTARVHARRSSARAFAERERVPRSRDPRSVTFAFASAFPFRFPSAIYRTTVRSRLVHVRIKIHCSIFISRAIATLSSQVSRRSTPFLNVVTKCDSASKRMLSISGGEWLAKRLESGISRGPLDGRWRMTTEGTVKISIKISLRLSPRDFPWESNRVYKSRM